MELDMGIFSVMDIYRIIYFAYRILNTCEGRGKMKEVAKLVAVQVTDDLTCYGYLMNNDKKILVDTLLDSLKAGEKAKGRKTGITRKDIEKIVERELKE
jgi:hypothetical protein